MIDGWNGSLSLPLVALAWLILCGLRAAAAALLRKRRDQPKQAKQPIHHLLNLSHYCLNILDFHSFSLSSLSGSSMELNGASRERACGAASFLYLFSFLIHSSFSLARGALACFVGGLEAGGPSAAEDNPIKFINHSFACLSSLPPLCE